MSSSGFAGHHVRVMLPYEISNGCSSSKVSTFPYANRGNLETSIELVEGEAPYSISSHRPLNYKMDGFLIAVKTCTSTYMFMIT